MAIFNVFCRWAFVVVFVKTCNTVYLVNKRCFMIKYMSKYNNMVFTSTDFLKLFVTKEVGYVSNFRIESSAETL